MIVLSLIMLSESRWMKSIITVGVFLMVSQFWIDKLIDNRKQQEVEEKFLEFVRALSNSVKAGIPVPKAVMMVSGADYGALTPYVKKLAKQLEWGFPLRQALMTFALGTGNKLIKKAINIVIEAEKGGGDIQEVLTKVTTAVLQIKKIKEERKSMIFSQILQGYIVFFIFIGIMVVLLIYLLPQMEGMGGMMTGQLMGGSSNLLDSGTEAAASKIDFNIIFTGLILIQGFFAGLMLGKFSEGELKHGIKHSLLMMLGGYLIFATAVGM
ncbi:type II secretion system F family protein [archaeon]|nr:type II secretion system F family protein [archaeon]